MSERLNDHFPALDENHKIFVLSPMKQHITRDVLRIHVPFFIKRYASIAFLHQFDDMHRMQGIERLHVIEFVPQRIRQSEKERDFYQGLRNLVAQRFDLMSGREAAFCNMWIKVNLP